MNPRNMKNLVAKNVKTFGEQCSWSEFEMIENDRGIPVPSETETIRTARLIIVKQKYSAISSFASSLGLSFDQTMYLICLPEVQIQKNMVITDSQRQKWKLDVVEPWAIAGIPVAKISALTEVA